MGAYEGEIWRNIRGHPVRLNSRGDPLRDAAKQKLGKKYHKKVTAEVLALSRKVQDFVANIIGTDKAKVTGQWWNPEFKRYVVHPIDILTPKWALEVKGRQTADAHPRLNMDPEKRKRKYKWVKYNGYGKDKAASIGVDTTTWPWTIYFRKGFGAYFYSSMDKVTPAELRKLIR